MLHDAPLRDNDQPIEEEADHKAENEGVAGIVQPLRHPGVGPCQRIHGHNAHFDAEDDGDQHNSGADGATGKWRRHLRSPAPNSWVFQSFTVFERFSNDGLEVDIVIEAAGQQIASAEVKAFATVTAADFRGLRKLKESLWEIN